MFNKEKISIIQAIAAIGIVLQTVFPYAIINNVLCQINVPALFILAGVYFRARKDTMTGRTLLTKGIKNYYLPALSFSIIFIFIFNLFVLFFLPNQATNSVLSPYSVSQFFGGCYNQIFNMNGYNHFICNIYWFFRSIIIGSCAFLLLLKAFKHFQPKQSEKDTAYCIILLGALLYYIAYFGAFRLEGLLSGGIRDIIVIVLIAVGYSLGSLSQEQNRYKKLLLLAFSCFALIMLSFLNKNLCSEQQDWLSIVVIPISGLSGFFLLSVLADYATENDLASKALNYVGSHYVYFLLLSCPTLQCLKTISTQGDVNQVNSNQISFLYSVFLLCIGIILPWIALRAKKLIKERFDLKFNVASYCNFSFFVKTFTWLLVIIGKILVFLYKKLQILPQKAYKLILGILHSIKSIIVASKPKDEDN